MHKLLYAFLFLRSTFVKGCGMSTHILVSEMALDLISNNSVVNSSSAHRLVSSVADILTANKPFLQAGSYFPDWGYMCSEHNGAEDSHWPLFWRASVEYFHQSYGQLKDPKSLPQSGKELMAFLFGLYSHGVSDIIWHSLGFDQGFIEAMANADFYRGFEAAHKYADPLSDVSVSRFTNMNHLTAWKLPSKDLVEIYKMRGFQNITEAQISKCTLLGLEITRANKLLGKYLFPALAPRTPFFTKELFHYHKGGILSMAVDVAECWLNVIDWFVEGVMSTKCKHLATAYDYTPHVLSAGAVESQKRNKHSILRQDCISLIQTTWLSFPRYIHCTATRLLTFTSNPNIHTQTSPIRLQGTARFKAKLASLSALLRSSIFSIWTSAKEHINPTCTPISTISSLLIEPDAKTGLLFGQAVAIANGIVAISAPGSSAPSEFMSGSVYLLNQTLLYSSKHRTTTSNLSPSILKADTKGGARFGHALCVLDFNKDGVLDLVVAAPYQGSKNDTPDGCIYVYFGLSSGGFPTTPNLVISGDVYSRPDGQEDGRSTVFGEGLRVGDVDGDGVDDLIVLSPKSTPFYGSPQVGQVHIFFSRPRKRLGVVEMKASDADFILTGSSIYGNFGNAVVVKNYGSYTIIVVGAPGYTVNDMQTSGALFIYSIEPTIPRINLLEVVEGTENKARFGSSLLVLESNTPSSLSLLVCSSSETSNNISTPRLANLPGIFVSPLDIGYQSGVCRGLDLNFQMRDRSQILDLQLSWKSNLVLSGTSSYSLFGHALQKVNGNHFAVSEPTVDGERGRVHLLSNAGVKVQCWSGSERHERFGSSLAFDGSRKALYVSSQSTFQAPILSGSVRLIFTA